MNVGIKKIHSKIENIEEIDVKEVIEQNDSLILKIDYKDEGFILFLKKTSNSLYVINATNPVDFRKIDFEKKQLSVSNRFNSHAIGSKCIAVDELSSRFIFSREEIISDEEINDETTIKKRTLLSLSIVMEAPDVFLSMDE